MSFSSNTEIDDRDVRVRCRCHEIVVWRTSWTELNPGRRFVGCPNFGGSRYCGFMHWKDPEVSYRYRVVMNGLLRKIDRLENGKKESKAKVCRNQWVVVVCCVIVLLAVFFSRSKCNCGDS